MPTPRTRKADSEDTLEAPPESTENKAIADETESKVPEVAPLEPPAKEEPAASPEAIRGPQELIPAELSEYIADDATGRPPADPDAVFVPVNPYGSSLRSTVRLVERVGLGIYRTPTTRLLVPAGAELTRAAAERIIARLHQQNAALAK